MHVFRYQIIGDIVGGTGGELTGGELQQRGGSSTQTR